ncbi:hypothetical protein DICSQDRAFT_160326 [Dichomitus squalens LYAD-421 SS1]|uniref:HTH La-type RNA-binding domain-containing protein n=1 Tax=Dichomitus squalens TaxID=114155 RepID=A0A4Q9Q2Q6_9APHY|nr:uncharacterized protein DICSQDRAFT_160326 [Dichomitus squalens LYAD-421 SS1]EJF63818.1 hypothetical protein DICSQDRAFT_160326 [Dichomitus squalens LYAD-421 SS1]TBU61136.1 hypothetical protein BD310DRAFT_813788 [Dichomitus squalens]
MVSPAPLAPANPPLSYADRAKKAQQNARPAAPQQPLSRASSQATSSIVTAASSPTASRPNVVSPSASRPSLPIPTGTDPRISPAATSSKPTSPSSADLSSNPRPNGDVNHHHGPTSSDPPALSTSRQSTVPPVNVWDKRKAEMAASSRASARTQSSQPLQPMSSSINPSLVASSASSPPPSSLDVSAGPSVSVSADISVKSSPSMPPSNTNGHVAHPHDYDDPFVVRPGRSPSVLNPTPPSITTPPAIDDAESWPEVGQAATTPINAGNGRVEGRAKETGEDDRGHEREGSGGHSSRKSEKLKWVPVPPEDLHFEGPVRNPHARQRPHNTDRSHPRQAGRQSATASSSSGQGSQHQSRTHSATGRRQTPSHAGSVSHSQAQSRTGSVHSSPRHASIRGGGRRLPDESSGPVFGANRSLRSSAANSPSTFAQPKPLPAEFIPGVGLRPYVNTSVTHVQPSALSAVPDSGAAAATSPAELNPHAAYYAPAPHAPPFGVSPYHSPHPAGSPAGNHYPLPPMGYPGQPGIPPPISMSGYGTPPPPYAMYSPYPYPYGQPYMYWPPPGVSLPPAMSSPMGHAQPGDGVPPPTMLARPPPPHESDAVAGYRDVGFALPPTAEVSQQGQEEEEQRRGRPRELSFGSIGAGAEGTSKSPSPAPASPNSGSVLEGAALGLDVFGGGQAALEAPAQGDVGGKGQKDVSGKAPTVLLIGVAPGEPTPARIRSRTHSKGPVASASAQAEISMAGKEGELPSAASEDPLAALADAAAKVIHLTDPLPETKWEFGTTKQTEDAAEPQAEFAPPLGPPPPPAADPSGIPAPPSFAPMPASYANAPPFIPPVGIPSHPVNGIPSAASPSTYVPPRQAQSVAEDEFEVRDYGYGFGRGVPAPVYPQAAGALHREDRPYHGGRDYQADRDQHYGGRPRRESYSGYYQRGTYGGRRARGLAGGYGGRGYQNRPYTRGGYNSQQQRQQTYVPPVQPPPQPEVNGYYAPPVAPLATYIPQAFEGYPYAPLPPPPPQAQNAGSQGAPLPMPQSNVGFPLDSTRYYLLGQLEYYLSPQNLAQDFYLRQQMDSRGWIPIALFASFNRVLTLTTDVQLVTEVLTLSSMVEVRNGHVRTLQWLQFVLPTAKQSQVEDDGYVLAQDAAAQSAGAEAPQDVNQNLEGEEDEEEDVVFVM